MSFHTLFITADPEIALHAEASGVDTIFIDMETRGKAERQGHLDTHQAAHTLEHVARISPLLTRAELLVRLNPLWEGTGDEVAGAAAAGAKRLMLPMFRGPREVASFKELVGGRLPVTLLVETGAALMRLSAILPLLEKGDRIHFGLNDLALDLKLGFLFEVLAGRLLDIPSRFCREAGVLFGIGGVGRVGQGTLPAEWIIGEHVRLGSESVILSRSFHNGAQSLAELTRQIDLPAEVASLRQCHNAFLRASAAELLDNQMRLAKKAIEIGEAASS
ncbi:MAG: aldolase/citrate lyase family protein [Novosphingobium sp.]